MGLVPQVFDEEKLSALPGEVAIGHTRYSTTGGAYWSNAQPLVHHGAARTVALAHNGNLVDPAPLRDELLATAVRLGSTSDTEVVAALLGRDPAPLHEAVASAMRRLEGAYSIVAIADGTLVAFRDPLGIRPLTLGRIGDDWVLPPRRARSTSSAPTSSGTSSPARWSGSTTRLPLGAGGSQGPQRAVHLRARLLRAAGLEAGWDGVHAARVRMGERLAEEAPADADLVMPIPDSGTPAAIGFAKRSRLPYEEGLIKNRYVGRTFIQPDQELRRQGIKLKVQPARRDRREAARDRGRLDRSRQHDARARADAARRGRRRGARPHLVPTGRVAVLLRDRHGRRGELAAAHRSVEEMREHVGATSLHYLSLDGMQWATAIPEEDVCRACFTRSYPTRVPGEGLAAKHRFEPAGATRR